MLMGDHGLIVELAWPTASSASTGRPALPDALCPLHDRAACSADLVGVLGRCRPARISHIAAAEATQHKVSQSVAALIRSWAALSPPPPGASANRVLQSIPSGM